MIRLHPPAFAFIDDDLSGIVALDIKIDKASIGKNDPQAKAFRADLVDRFALHRFKGHYSFHLRPYHDLSDSTDSIPLQQRIMQI